MFNEVEMESTIARKSKREFISVCAVKLHHADQNWLK
jgi:hypothetical protein